jgi:Taurine catabolism dioxygenase TauD, TfdA family
MFQQCAIFDQLEHGTPQVLLKVTWNTGTTKGEVQTSFYDWNWLQTCRYNDKTSTQITPAMALGRHASCPPIQEISYQDLFPNDNKTAESSTLFQILHAVAEQGAVLIQKAPLLHDKNESMDANSAVVAKVGRALSGGALSHGALHGDIFHVQSLPQAHNIAYTNIPLCPRQDLAYYESKLGLQLLHCAANNNNTGGESVLVDALAAA